MRVKHNGSVYVKAESILRKEDVSDPDDWSYWYMGDPGNTDYHPVNADYPPAVLNEWAVENLLRSEFESAYRLVARAAQQLGLQPPVVFLVDLSSIPDVAKYMDGSHRVLLVDPAKSMHSEDTETSLLHELAHAYLESWGRYGEDADERDEELAEWFAVNYPANRDKTVQELVRRAEELTEEE